MIVRKIFSILFFVAIATLGGCNSNHAGRDSMTLWFDAPATRWEATLPLGNGRLGAMPDGGVASERIVLNDISLWSGSEQQTANPEALSALPQIRKLLLEGRNYEAQELMQRKFVCSGGGSAETRYGCFQTMGALTLDFGAMPQSTAYERGLNIANATAYTTFVANGVSYHRDYFVSRTADVIAIRLQASKAGALSFTCALSRPENATISCDNSGLAMRGNLPSGDGDQPGMGYVAKAAVQAQGGSVEYLPEGISVKGADEAVIYVSGSTSWWGDDYEAQADSLLRNALASNFDKLRTAHIADYKTYFDRVSLDLGGDVIDLPTDQRLARFETEADPALAALYMQYGRYLMLSSTREGSLPPNLQGLWADGVKTPWNGDYHLNINVQMNHWICGPGNLVETQRPLVEYIKGLVPSGEQTSRDFYNTGGWVAHVISNPWNFTSPAENPSWGATNTGGAWLALHLWEQYRFTADTAYLREVYPILRGAAEFFVDNLVAEPKNGWLVTSPTSSPENSFYDEKGRETAVCMGSTMDTQIIRELFGAVCQSSELLGVDVEFAARLQETSRRMPPYQVSEKGYLMEWLQDYKEAQPQHRHVSHLFGLYPGGEMSRRQTPALMDACRATLEARGDEGTGWSRAWKICFWARLGDGNRAYKLLHSLLQPAVVAGAEWDRGGTYPNLFCSHAPFQIDGNFGGAAGIAEMLLQSHDGVIELLPALPDSWPTGQYRGLLARGGVEVDCTWADGTVQTVTLRAPVDCQVRLLLPSGVLADVACQAGKPLSLKL